MKKFLFLIMFLYLPVNLFSATGSVQFMNATKNMNLQFKFKETHSKKSVGWSKKIKPGDSWKISTKRKISAPDVKDVWVKVYNVSGRYYGTYRWSKNIRIDNNKTTKVNFSYNSEKAIPLRRQVFKPGTSKIEENYGDNNGPQGTICFHNLERNYYLGVDYRLSGKDDWRYVKLGPESSSILMPTGSHALAARDIRDMVVTIFRADDLKPVDVAVWSKNVNIKNGKRTDVYFDVIKNKDIEIDKRLDKKHLLVRKVEVGNSIKENYQKSYGADTKLRQAKILIQSLFDGSFKRKNNKIDLEKWIKPDRRLRLDQVVMLSAHNAFSNYKSNYRFYYQQYYGLKEQFDMGVRCFLLDCYPTKPGKNIDIKKSKRPVESKLCHGKCELGPVLRMKDEFNYKNLIKSVWNVKQQKQTDYITITLEKSLNILKKLLDENKDEIVCIELENYTDHETTDKAIESSGISSIILKPSEWDILKEGGLWPTLDWMIKQNKRVIFWSDHGGTKYAYDQWEIQRSNMYGAISRVTGALDERLSTQKKLNKNLESVYKKIGELKLQIEQSNDLTQNYDLNHNIIKLENKVVQLKSMKYLSAINLFPGNLLENAQKFIGEAAKKIEIKDPKEWHLKAGLSEIIKALRNVKLYWDIDYKSLNENILPKIVKEVVAIGLNDTGNLKGQMPNLLNLDQVHEGNSMKLVNKLNEFASKKLDNPNLLLESVF